MASIITLKKLFLKECLYMVSRAKLPEQTSFRKACQKRYERAEIKRRETLSRLHKVMSLRIAKNLQRSLEGRMNSQAARQNTILSQNKL